MRGESFRTHLPWRGKVAQRVPTTPSGASVLATGKRPEIVLTQTLPPCQTRPPIPTFNIDLPPPNERPNPRSEPRPGLEREPHPPLALVRAPRRRPCLISRDTTLPVAMAAFSEPFSAPSVPDCGRHHPVTLCVCHIQGYPNASPPLFPAWPGA